MPKVILFYALTHTYGQRLHIPPGHSTVMKEALHENPSRSKERENLFVSQGNKTAHVDDRIFLRAHKHAVGIAHHLADNPGNFLFLHLLLAFFDKISVFGETRTIKK